jgi:hypothetical protein
MISQFILHTIAEIPNSMDMGHVPKILKKTTKQPWIRCENNINR